jgi:hypothetical protein
MDGIQAGSKVGDWGKARTVSGSGQEPSAADDRTPGVPDSIRARLVPWRRALLPSAARQRPPGPLPLPPLDAEQQDRDGAPTGAGSAAVTSLHSRCGGEFGSKERKRRPEIGPRGKEGGAGGSAQPPPPSTCDFGPAARTAKTGRRHPKKVVRTFEMVDRSRDVVVDSFAELTSIAPAGGRSDPCLCWDHRPSGGGSAAPEARLSYGVFHKVGAGRFRSS